MTIQAFAMAGAFDKAGDLALHNGGAGEDRLPHAVVLLYAGRGADAVEPLRRYLSYRQEEGGEGLDEISCVADALEAKAGDEAAMAHLRRAERDPCRIAYANLLDGQARLEALGFFTEAPDRFRDYLPRRQIVALMARAAGDAPQAQKLGLDTLRNRLLHEFPVYSSGTRLRAHGLDLALLEMLAQQDEIDWRDRTLRRWLAVRPSLFATSAGKGRQAVRWSKLAFEGTKAGRRAPRASDESTQRKDFTDARAEDAALTALLVRALVFAGQHEEAQGGLTGWGSFLSPTYFQTSRSSCRAERN